MSDVRAFGARGDGKTDDTEAVQRAVNESDGLVSFPSGTFVISSPVEVDLRSCGRTSITGAEGCAKLVMTGAGPALHIAGGHEGTASPASLTTHVLEEERFATVAGIEIAGAHPEADGIRLDGLWQPQISRVYVHDCRHGIHVVRRNRNVIIAECHVHNNRGVGIFYDHLNLHQSNITGSHISYNKQGGIKVLKSEIRNLQICSNDIEYNYDLDAEESADVWIETLSSSIREGTIAGNTIQAMPSPGGANVRFRGRDGDDRRKAGNWAISGNLISSQMVNIHLQFARGIVITGNSFFSGHERSLRLEQSECIVIGANTLDRHPDYRAASGGGVTFDDCSACNMSGCTVLNARANEPNAEAAVDVRNSREISVTGCQILDCAPRGLALINSENCMVSGCTIIDRQGDTQTRDALLVRGGTNNLVAGNLQPTSN